MNRITVKARQMGCDFRLERVPVGEPCPFLKVTSKYEGTMPNYEIIINSTSLTEVSYKYRDPQSGEEFEAVKKENKLYTQEGIELCTLTRTKTPAPSIKPPAPKLGRLNIRDAFLDYKDRKK